MFCKRYRYNLSHLESQTCPECGRAFDPGNRKTFRKTVGFPKWLRRVGQGLLLLFVATLIAAGVIEWRYQQELAGVEVIEQVGGHVDWSEDAHMWAKAFSLLHKRLQHATVVNFSHSQLTTLPPEIGLLTNATELHLNNGRFTTLPPEIGKLTKLDYLDMGDNLITSLPPEIGKLTSLTEWYLYDSKLTALPPEISELASLAYLNLAGNPITDADLEHLKSLRNLLYIDISGANVTKDGVASLMKALPNCEIESNFSFPTKGQAQ